MEHSNARIIGNTEGITALINLLCNALENGKASSHEGGSHVNPNGEVIGEPECMFASDGEGYELTIECNNDSIDYSDLDEESKKNFWNDKKNYPKYITSEIDKILPGYRSKSRINIIEQEW